MFLKHFHFILSLTIGLTACSSPAPLTPDRAEKSEAVPPLIIAHRGASGELPEHTLAAYELAIAMGADFIEPDLVMTKDGHLIVRHDRYLSGSTDISDRPEFADRKRKRDHNGKSQQDWWAEDFTLAEIKTLRARQPFPGRSKHYDGEFEIPTLDEVLTLVCTTAQDGRIIGLYPEIKSPAYHASVDLPMERALIDALDGSCIKTGEVPVFIQSFEQQPLYTLAEISHYPLVQLLTGDARAVKAGFEPPLSEAVHLPFAGLGPYKGLLYEHPGFIQAAHENGKTVHTWTLRQDRLGNGFKTYDAELQSLIELGADGIFTDHPSQMANYLNRPTE